MYSVNVGEFFLCEAATIYIFMCDYLDVWICSYYFKKEEFQSWTVSPCCGSRLESLPSICTALPACITCVSNKDRINIYYTAMCYISKCCCKPAVVSRRSAQLSKIYIVCFCVGLCFIQICLVLSQSRASRQGLYIIFTALAAASGSHATKLM